MTVEALGLGGFAERFDGDLVAEALELNGPCGWASRCPRWSPFARISTDPRAYERPLPPAEAWEQVEEWLAAPAS